MKADHWSRRTLDFITPHLEEAKQSIHVSTGFFSVQGYDLIRQYLDNKAVLILVGYDEDSKDRLREKLIEDIMWHLRRWEGDNRREAVFALVQKLQAKELRIVEIGETEIIDARIRKKDHAKIYILDNDVVLVGSSNLTKNGLLYNTEGVTTVTDIERVRYWVEQYEIYWTAKDTYDLTDELLSRLLRWLELNKPYDVYLKTLLALNPEDLIEAPRTTYKMPVKYQQVVIERVLRQLDDWRGAMLVASTGLGKTVMATHIAYRLMQEGKIMNVIVFAPLQVSPDWDDSLESAGISYKIFTRDLLDQPSTKRSKKVNEILRALDKVDEKYIIFIDESHHFRNRERAKDGEEREAFKRLVNVANERSPYVMLLTATPLAKGIDDLNNQLYLLPHTAPPNYQQDNGQLVMEAFAEYVMKPTVWKIADKPYEESYDFFDAFMNLPVCTVISTSQVAKDFATPTPDGDYIDFGEHRRWLPQIEVEKVKIPIQLEREMTEALDKGYFKHELFTFQSRGQWIRSDSSVEKEANIAWASSPTALNEVIQNTINGVYEVPYIMSEEEREDVLGSIGDKILNQSYEDDLKLMALIYYLESFKEEGRKVIIFTERRSTAHYIEQAVLELLPKIRATSVVRQDKDGSYELKSFEEVYEMILNFAPEANRDKIPPKHKSISYDVFISTDAYGAGVNLQDASVVISYDLAWTPDVIIQRAGRILRLWSKPRKVYLLAFVARFEHSVQRQRESQRVEDRLRRLSARTTHAERFSELPIIPESDKVAYKSLSGLSNVTVEHLGEIDITKIEEFSGVSPYLRHITELNQNMAYAKDIPDDITSALSSEVKTPQLYLLLKFQGEYRWTLYDIESNRFADIKEDELLGLLQCSVNEPVADVNPDIIEEVAQHAKTLWCKRNNIEKQDLVERIAALYIIPEQRADFENILGG